MWLSNTEIHDSSQKAYLLRAIYSWIEDHDLTPHLFILYSEKWTSGIPRNFLNEQLILNISSTATRNLQFHEESLSFRTRFAGQDHEVLVDYEAVVGLFARENQQGIQFEPDLEKLRNPPLKTESTLKTNPFKIIK